MIFFSICFRSGKSYLAIFREQKFNKLIFTSNTAARKIQAQMFILSLKILCKILHPPSPLQQNAEPNDIFLYWFFRIFTVLIFVDQFSLIHFSSLTADLCQKKKKRSISPMNNSNFPGYKIASLAPSIANCFFQVEDSNPWVHIMGLIFGGKIKTQDLF